MKYSENRRMKILIVMGLVLAALGAAAGFFLPEEQHALTRAAGACAGMGSAFACMGAVILLRRSRMSEAQRRARDLAVGDERGTMVAYKAQNLTAIAAVLLLAMILAVATVRGDRLYMSLGTAALLAVCGVKLAAWYWYNKTT